MYKSLNISILEQMIYDNSSNNVSVLSERELRMIIKDFYNHEYAFFWGSEDYVNTAMRITLMEMDTLMSFLSKEEEYFTINKKNFHYIFRIILRELINVNADRELIISRASPDKPCIFTLFVDVIWNFCFFL